jgi:hypothetical protein
LEKRSPHSGHVLASVAGMPSSRLACIRPYHGAAGGGGFADSGSLAAIHEAPPAAPREHLTAGGDHRPMCPASPTAGASAPAASPAAGDPHRSQPGWSPDALPVAAGWRWPVRDAGRGERRGQPSRPGNRGQAGIRQAWAGDDQAGGRGGGQGERCGGPVTRSAASWQPHSMISHTVRRRACPWRLGWRPFM